MQLHALTFHDEGDEVVVGRFDTDAFGVFPPDGAALLRYLLAGADPAEAAVWYAESYGEAVDMDAFVSTLDDLGFVCGDGEVETYVPVQVAWQRLGRAVFSPLAALMWCTLVTAAVVVCVTHARLVPDRRHVFFSSSLLVVELTVLIGQVPLTLLHEASHLLAGRRLGVRSRIRVSHRLNYVVFETVLDGLVAVPRPKRYLPLAAGVIADIAVMAALVLTSWVVGIAAGRPTVGAAVCLALAYTTIPRVLWQCSFFLRTDVYYAMQVALRSDDLDGAARDVLRNWVRRLRGGVLVPRESRPERDWRMARWFAPILVGGYCVVLASFAVVVAPLMWNFVHLAVERVGSGAGGLATRLDAAGVLVLNSAETVVALALSRRALASSSS